MPLTDFNQVNTLVALYMKVGAVRTIFGGACIRNQVGGAWHGSD